ncbi:MAG: hypothetical protein U0V73_00370 [Acidimicrobiia bacterium]
MDLSEFTRSLATMTEPDLRAVARAIERHSQSAGDEVDAWRATLAIDRCLRRARRTRLAAHAAYSAGQAVLAAATAAGFTLPDPVVTAVARSAAELARAVVGGMTCEPEVRPLVETWSEVNPLVAA